MVAVSLKNSQSHRDLRRRIDGHKEEMDKLEADLDLALRKEKDDIARLLIRRRRMLESTCRHLQAQLETLTQEESALAATVADQRLQYDTLKTKADAYCQQAARAPFPARTDPLSGEWASMDPKEEEIELELLQRKEALRKLDLTERDLLRVEDIIEEIGKQVRSLARQVGWRYVHSGSRRSFVAAASSCSRLRVRSACFSSIDSTFSPFSARRTSSGLMPPVMLASQGGYWDS